MLRRLAYQPRERADLHLHSHHSDGLHAPDELVQLALERGLAAVALTDHASVAGISAMSVAGARLGLHVIPGVELNAGDGDLLGLWVDNFHPPFLDFLAGLRVQRAQRMDAVLRRLAALDIHVRPDALRRFAAPAEPARTHLARMLVARGHCSSVDCAFQRYLGRRGQAWVPGEAPSLERCLAVIGEAGGVAVEAHPLFQLAGWDGDLDERYATLAEQGLVGVERIPPPSEEHAPLARRIERAASRAGLLLVGGSNFHGEGITRARLGEPSVGCDRLRELERLLPVGGFYRDATKRNAWRARHLAPAELEQSFQPSTVCFGGSLRLDLLALEPPGDRPAVYPPGRPYVLLGPGALDHEAQVVATIAEAGGRRLHAVSGGDYPRVGWHVYEMFGGTRPRDPRDLLRFALDRQLWGPRARRCRVLWFDAPPGLDLEALKAQLRRGIGRMRFYRVVAGGLRDCCFTSYLHLPDPEDIDRECWHLARLGLHDAGRTEGE